MGTMGKRSLDLLYPTPEEEKRKHKLKRLVQSPNSFFMDVKCPGCFHITPVFSHAQIVVFCSACSTALCQPTGGRPSHRGLLVPQEGGCLNNSHNCAERREVV